MFSILAMNNNEALPNSIHYFAKVESNFALQFCQSGDFSPNLVTLYDVLSFDLVLCSIPLIYLMFPWINMQSWATERRVI